MSDPQAAKWGGRHWSDWCSLVDATAASKALAPAVPGIYRVRGSSQDGLIYIGQTGRSLRGRLRQLAAGLRSPSRRAPHFAAPCVRQHIDHGWMIEVSWIELPEDKVPKRERFGIECDLIALYRKIEGESPTCQFAGELEL